MSRFCFEEDGERRQGVRVRRIVTGNGEATVTTSSTSTWPSSHGAAWAAMTRRAHEEQAVHPEAAGELRPASSRWFHVEDRRDGGRERCRNMIIVVVGFYHGPQRPDRPGRHHPPPTGQASAATAPVSPIMSVRKKWCHSRPGPPSPWPRTGPRPPRLQNTPSFWYMHSDQWRYDRNFVDYFNPETGERYAVHTADFNAKAVGSAGCRSSPHFNESTVQSMERRGGRSSDGR